MMSKKYKYGFTGTYIQDHPFSHLTEIPPEVAVAWVAKLYPDMNMGSDIPAKDLGVDTGDNDTDAKINGWLNKLFILVANEHDRWIALVNWDGRFSIYIERDDS